MSTKFFSILPLFMIAVLFAACTPLVEASGQSTAVEDLGSLSQALRAAGATIESGETLQQDFFSVEGQIIKINGADVQVFEYKSAEAMEAEAALVAADGGSVGTSMMMWFAPPHFFKSGRILVLYVGEDANVLNLLGSVFGQQFVGG